MQKYQTIILSVLLAVSAFFQYSNTLSHNYVWDDLIVITNNEKVKKGLGGLKEIFTEYNPSSEELDEQYGYRPITLSSFAIDVAIFGTDSYYGHLMNILYFSLLCVVLFWCLRMLFYSYSIWLPFFATLLFVVHPIHVEVVANIKSRDEIFALLFGLLALVTAIRYIEKDKIYYAALSVFCFILAILSKEHLTIFSLVIPLTIMLFYKIDFNKILKLTAFYLVIVVMRLFAFSEISYVLPILFIILGLSSLFIFHKIITFFENANHAQIASIVPNNGEELMNKVKGFWKKNAYKLSIFTIILFFISLFSYQAYLPTVILLIFVLFYTQLDNVQKNNLLPFLGLAFAAFIYLFSEKNILPIVYVLLIIQAYYQPIFIRNTVVASIFIFLAAFSSISIGLLAIILVVPLAFAVIVHYTNKDILLGIGLVSFGLLLLILTGELFIPISFILLGLLAYSKFADTKFPNFISPILFFFLVGFLLTAKIDNYAIKEWATIQEKVKTSINTAIKTVDIVPEKKNKQDEWGLYIEDMAIGNSILFAESSSEYAATSFFILGKYIKNFFVPYPLVYFYGYNQIPVTTFANWKVLLSILLYILLIFGAFLSLFRYKNKAMFFGIMFYIFNIMLFSHFVLALPDTMSDRYLFMPSVGLCIFTVLVIGQLLGYSFRKEQEKKTVLASKVVSQKPKPKPKPKKHKKKDKKTKSKQFDVASMQAYKKNVFAVPIILLCLLFATMTYERNKAWKNEVTLFSTDMPHLENCARANYYYGNTRYRAYPDAATETERTKLKEEMLYRFDKAINITDKSFYAFWHLTRAYMNFAMYDEAYETLQKAYEVYPDEFKTHHLMGMYFYYTQDYETAIEWFEKAEKLAVKNQDNYFYLAWSYYKNGEQEKGIDIMEKAVESQPEYEGFYNVLSDLYFDYGEIDKGIVTLEKVIEMKPDFAPAYQKLVRQLRELGESDRADAYYQKGAEKGVF